MFFNCFFVLFLSTSNIPFDHVYCFSSLSNEGTPLGQPSSNAVLPGGQPELSDERTVTELKKSGETTVDASADQQKGASQRTMDSHTAPQQNGSAISRVPLSVQHSPRRKTRITSLDEVLKLLHEKQLEQQLQNKEVSSSSRARMKWQHSMLVALRKSRLTSNSETSKSSASVVNERENVAPELDEKTARIKYREISEKYDHVIEDEKQKMLRRETLLKKRRNSLILRQDILEKKLAKSRESSKTQLKKKLSKDNKDIPLSLTKGDSEELTKQLAEISKELEGIKQNMDTNLKEHQKISDDLNEKKRKELHELRITVDMSPHSSKSNLNEHGSKLHRRQMSDTSLITMSRTSEDFRKMSVRAEAEKPRLTQSLSSPSEDLRPKAKSFSSQRLPKVPSSPLLRAKTYDSTRTLVRPSVKSRTSQEALSVALSQIEV